MVIDPSITLGENTLGNAMPQLLFEKIHRMDEIPRLVTQNVTTYAFLVGVGFTILVMMNDEPASLSMKLACVGGILLPLGIFLETWKHPPLDPLQESARSLALHDRRRRH